MRASWIVIGLGWVVGVGVAGAQPQPQPPPTRPVVAGVPLQIIAHQPVGAEQTPPQISVTFNQPMVPVTGVGELTGPVPIRVVPEIPGAWKWQGTSLLLLQPKGRLKFATHYVVTVPAGTRSADGHALDKPFSFSFETPRPVVVSSSPSDQSTEVGLEPTLQLWFNQHVTASRLAPLVSLVGPDGKRVAVRAVAGTRDDQPMMATFAPAEKLAPNTTYRLEVKAGVVSDEGPLPGTRAYSATFSTYPPLEVRALRCDCNHWGTDSSETCQVGQPICVTFNHPIKVAKPDDHFAVTPRPKDLKIRVSSNQVQLDATYEAEQTYKVDVARGLVDNYGQPLAKGWSRSVRFEHLPTAVELLVESESVIETQGRLTLPLRLTNADTVGVTAYRLGEEQLGPALAAVGHSTSSSSFTDALRALQSAKVDAWQERPGLPKDKPALYALSLRRLVQQHGAGTFLLVVAKSERAVVVQLTDLGLTARYDSDQMVVLATSIATGRPLPGVSVHVVAEAGKPQPVVRTGADGVAVLRAVPRSDEQHYSQLLVHASLGSDRAYVRASSYGDDSRATSLNWGKPHRPKYKRPFFYPDRDLYRPGETVHIYGIEREYAAAQLDKIGVPSARPPVTWTATSARDRELARGTVTPTLFGTFYFSFKLPDGVDLGNVHIQTSVGTTNVNVQEYRAPEFEVAVKLATPTIFFGDTVRATLSGRYLFGAPMKGADATWTLYGSEARFSAPGHAEYHFGSAIEPWSRHERHYYRHYRDYGPSPLVSGNGKLDDRGQLSIAAPLVQSEQLDPQSLLLDGSVTDVSRQVVAGRASALAHPADRYIGVRVPGPIVEANRPASIEIVVVDLEGKRVPQVAVAVEAVAQQRELLPDVDDEGNATTKSVPRVVAVKSCTVTSADAPQSCALTFPRSGSYLVQTSSVDSKQRPVRTRLYVEVVGKDTVLKDTKAGRVELKLDRATYQPGQTAQLTVRTPFADGVALVTEERRGLVGHQVIKISGYRGTAKIAVREDHVPNLELSATAIMARGKDRPTAAWATGSATLSIARDPKQLVVIVRPAKETARPGETVPIEVRVTDAQKRPVAVAVSLVAVDEAVLGMTGWKTPAPLDFFHYVRPAEVALAELLKHLLPEKPPEVAPAEERKKSAMAPSAKESMAEDRAGGAGGPSGRSGPGAVAVRRSFLTTPAAIVLTTNAQGLATFSLPLPDNLTRFRVMAVAADGTDRFGSGESAIRVQKPLQLRASLPRFLNTSDAFAAGVIVDNQTTQAGSVEITVEASGVELQDPPRRTITVAAGEAQEIVFAARAPRPGTATFRFTATLGAERDAVEQTLPIAQPATAEAFATYGTSMTHVAQPIATPKDVLPSFGGLSISLASTALTGLQDAAKYLVEYPYGCVEQISGKLMPLVVLGDLVEQFKLGGAETLALQKKHAAVALERIFSGQRSDGSWGTWGSAGDEGRADLTAYVLLVLRRAKDAGMVVPDDVVTRASAWLVQWMERRRVDDPKEPRYTRRWQLDIQAMALYALGDWGQKHEAYARRLYPHAAELDLFARAMLAAVFHRLEPKGKEREALYRELLNRAIQTPSSARFQESQSESLQLLMHSSSRTDAMILLVLLELDAKNELIPKIARGLMDARVNGRWDTTQANSYALWALARYFAIYEAEPAAFATQVWLGKRNLGERKFAGRSMLEELFEVPMQTLIQSGAKDVTLGKTGTGRLYYRIGMKYAPRDLVLKSLDQGFTVTRRYEGVASPADVQRDKDGTWRIKAGAYVRVRLQVIVQDRRFYVAVDDALPAGLELVNTAYKTAAMRPQANRHHDEGDGDWLGAYPSWRFNHRELRDDRSVHFADELTPGTYQLDVLARATVRGEFLVPPTRAEEMYHPEMFGRTSTDRVSIR